VGGVRVGGVVLNLRIAFPKGSLVAKNVLARARYGWYLRVQHHVRPLRDVLRVVAHHQWPQANRIPNVSENACVLWGTTS